MKILVAIDFSDNAFHAGLYALTWANAKGSGVHLLHVIEAPVSAPHSVDDALQVATESLHNLARKLMQVANHCNITHSVTVGAIVDEIDRNARELHAGLIVMGIHGVSRGDRYLFGSNALSLVRDASFPILVVPQNAQTREPRKMVFATDYHDSDLEALHQLLPTARFFDSDIEIVHVFDEGDEQESETIMMDAIAGEIRKKVDYAKINFQVFHHDKVSDGIQQFSQATAADIVVVSARKLTAFQKMFGSSVSEQLIYHSQVPILVFHTHRTSEHIMQLS